MRVRYPGVRVRILSLFLAVPLLAPSCRDTTAPGAAGTVLWKASLGHVSNQSTPGLDDDHVYVTANGLTALRRNDGVQLWTTGTALFGVTPANFIARDGRVFGAGTNAAAVDASNGRTLWTYTPDNIASPGTIAADERSVYFGTDRSHRVYALDVQTGLPRWVVDIGPDWQYPGTVWGVSVSGDTVYAGATQSRSANYFLRSGWVAALDRNSGAILWRASSGAGDTIRSVQSAPAVSGRFLVATDVISNTFFALDRFTGKETWRTIGDQGYVGPRTEAVILGDTVFVASGDLTLYAVNLPSGRLLFKRVVSGGSINAYAACGTSMAIQSLALRFVSRSGGDPLDRLLDGDTEFISSGLAAKDNVVYATSDYSAYAVRCP